mmetsp:Transcript_9799/g.17606  ORF Transcript_9799/g.17606 Transcript_9799/m.17606 type:complete len:342 (+) Transcript_9799:83-1108(+)|eukprot:CAMPEP_0197664136 /NCGR_PEP_ID=MMETSP1338-20131121/58453_1 /TAXON_ID=43686 ORGANISM="Pelagodinium beii, Strain RCC1491" /NCGR_SAMPLE_ID=MMETSP1338 /ASSEMBLY_ACC=CAM_ASM_000754 /LENGTH=341 /DNA_ID=CAMNT_0043242713 /DNA_START=15 /DNA_END=1040 /DNA_ORIENTATION=-
MTSGVSPKNDGQEGYETVKQTDEPDTIGAGVVEEGLEEAAKPSPEAGTKQSVAFGVALYAACSSTLLLINKVSVHMVPDASFVLFCQFIASSISVRAMKMADPQADIELLTLEKAKPFSLACGVFFLCLLANTQALKSVNVETVIVARSCSPIAVCVLEHFTLGKDLPNLHGMLSLGAIAGGAVLYVVTDEGFKIDGYAWLLFYFVFIVVEMVFVKFVVETIPMSTWTRVYYNNTLSIPMVIASSVALGFGDFMKVEWGILHLLVIALSCIVGLAISYAGFNLRKLISATSFTVIGVMCKIITVLINDIVWTQHSNMMGHLGLLFCIGAGFAYERSKVQSK